MKTLLALSTILIASCSHTDGQECVINEINESKIKYTYDYECKESLHSFYSRKKFVMGDTVWFEVRK